MKSRLYRGIVSICTCLLYGSLGYADFTDDFPYSNGGSSNAQPDSIKEQITTSVIDKQGPIQQLINLFIPDTSSGLKDKTLTGYIAYILNIALSLVAFIAVIVIIIGFYGIYFGKTEEGIQHAKNTVKGAAIAIIIMGASWTIIKLIFYFVQLLT